MRSLALRRRQPKIKSSRHIESSHLSSILIEIEHPPQLRHSKNLDKPTLALVINKVEQTMIDLALRNSIARSIRISRSTVMTLTLKIFSECSSKTLATSTIYLEVSLCKWASNSREVETGVRIISTSTNSLEGMPTHAPSACPVVASHFLRHLAPLVSVSRGKGDPLSINRLKIRPARKKESFVRIKTTSKTTEILTKITITPKIIDKQEENRITLMLKKIRLK